MSEKNLEETLKEINTLIEQMEKNELSLEQSLANFERGVHLIKYSQHILQTAEQKVQLLMNENGLEKLIPFDKDQE